MRITRIYQNKPLNVANEIQLDTTASHHLIHVLRLPQQSKVILFNGDGTECTAYLSKIDKRNAHAIIEEKKIINRESPLQIYLAQGISRGERMDFTLQKAVELGVAGIIPLITERCGIKLSQERWEKRYLHWQQIIISACEQSGRNKIPELLTPISLEIWLSQKDYQLKLILDPQGKSTITELETSQTNIALLIGPEGGLSEQEIQLAQQHNFKGIKLGNRILRTETAALATIAALQLQAGDFK